MDPILIFRIGIFLIVLLISLTLGSMLMNDINQKRDKLLKSKNVIEGSYSETATKKTSKKEKKEERTSKSEKELKGFKSFYYQYIFFYDTNEKGRVLKEEEKRKMAKLSLIKLVGIGMIVSFVIYFLITRNIGLTILLSPLYLVAAYFYSESKIQKKRIKYVRSFASSLDIIASSVKAGNSLEEGIKVISRRESVMPELKKQFVLLNNHIKSNISMVEALEMFGERNKMFEEFNMFVIVMQFFIKTGGKNLDKVFETMQEALNQKVENYSIIESKLVTYQYAFNFFVFGYIVISLLAPFFITGFYHNITTDPNGIAGVGFSVFLLLAGVWMFKSSVRSAAEA